MEGIGPKSGPAAQASEIAGTKTEQAGDGRGAGREIGPAAGQGKLEAAPTGLAEGAKEAPAPDAKPAGSGGPESAHMAGSGAPATMPAGKAAEAPAHAAAPPHPVVHQVPMGTVPLEIGLKALAGVKQFEIRLDPAELGRIEVRLDISDAGEVKAHVTVDRVETLALLQRDAKSLERAFEQAGLTPADGGVDLSLRDRSPEGRQDQGRERRDGDSPGPGELAGSPAEPVPAPPPRSLWRGTTGIDVRI